MSGIYVRARVRRRRGASPAILRGRRSRRCASTPVPVRLLPAPGAEQVVAAGVDLGRGRVSEFWSKGHFRRVSTPPPACFTLKSSVPGGLTFGTRQSVQVIGVAQLLLSVQRWRLPSLPPITTRPEPSGSVSANDVRATGPFRVVVVPSHRRTLKVEGPESQIATGDYPSRNSRRSAAGTRAGRFRRCRRCSSGW